MRVAPAALLLFVCLALAPSLAEGQPDDTRALWVVRTTMTSPAAIRGLIAAARAGDFNTLFVQVRGRGDAYYRSRLEPPAAALAGSGTFDPLTLTIREARAAGLNVHAWVNVNLVADAANLPTDRRHLVRRHPDWLMVPRELVDTLGRMDPKDPRYLSTLAAWTQGHRASVEGLYTSPSHPRVVEHLLAVVDDLVSRYDLDGVHFDYIRYPGVPFDFSRGALKAFNADVSRRLPRQERARLKRQLVADPLAGVDQHPAAWESFRRDRVTSLLRRLRTQVQVRRPGTIVSAAVVPIVDEARVARGQDWPAWLQQGLLDVVCPMAYTTDAEAFAVQVAEVQAAAASAGRRVFAGVGAYRLTTDQTILRVVLAREAGVDGFILFSYDSFVAQDRGSESLVQIGRAVSGR